MVPLVCGVAGGGSGGTGGGVGRPLAEGQKRPILIGVKKESPGAKRSVFSLLVDYGIIFHTFKRRKANGIECPFLANFHNLF